MNKYIPLIFICGLFQTFSAQSQCIDTLPSNTIILSNDTIINNANGVVTYLICPGVEVNYTGNMSVLVHYYMEEGAFLNINNYHYPTVYMQSTAEVKANHSIAAPLPSLILKSVAEYGAVFTDTLNQYTGEITWCSNLVFDYSNLPGGLGCPAVTALDKVVASSNLKVYPNPVNRFIYVEFENAGWVDSHFVCISNSLGQIVLNQKITEKQLSVDIAAWGGKGLYFLSVLDEAGKVIELRKVLVE